MTLTRFGFCLETYIDLHVAALLHDVVEDEKAKLSLVRKTFGKEISIIVDLVTDKDGDTRKERHEKTYPLIATNPSAIIVKLADRITNVEYSIATNNLKQFRKYQKEYMFFRNTLFNPEQTETIEMWNTLDEHFLIEEKV